MKNKQLILAVSILGATLGKTAVANELDTRLYIAPTATYIWTDSDRFTSRNDYGVSVGLGKAISEDFNLELKANYNSFEHKQTKTAQTQYQWDSFGSTLDLQYYFNRNDLSPYAVVGAGYTNSRVHGKSAGGIVGEAGLGLAYKVNNHISLRSDVRYRYNDNFDKHLVPNETTTYNEMLVNVGVVIPFGSAPSKTQARSTVVTNDDLDNDGVRNSADKCPDTKPGVKVNLVGCDLGITLKGVNFNVNSAELTVNAKSLLKPVVAEIKAYPTKKDIEIQGHASSDGDADKNMVLSQKRAETVVNYLKEKGVTNNLTAKGYGETMPVADESLKDGRQQNRRVDMVWK